MCADRQADTTSRLGAQLALKRHDRFRVYWRAREIQHGRQTRTVIGGGHIRKARGPQQLQVLIVEAPSGPARLLITE